MKTLTLKEIAQRAGVSTATVSYVINNSGHISEETRKKVQDIIRQTGYRTNKLAGSLRKNRTGLIGILVEDITVWHTPYIIDGINRLADEKNCYTILSNLQMVRKIDNSFDKLTGFQKDIDKAVQTLLGLQVDGIIYIGMHDRLMDNVLRKAGKPVVYCYCYTADGEASSVRYDNEKAEYRITRNVIDRGHQRIALIGGYVTSEPARLRRKGFLKALQEAGITLPESWDECGEYDFQKGKAAAIRILTGKDGGTKKDLLPRQERPTAMVAMNDEMALGVYNAAAELGLRIPEDLSVTGFDDAEFTQQLIPPLMTAQRPLHKMGYSALSLLLERIEDESEQVTNIIYPCRIIEGASVSDFRTGDSTVKDDRKTEENGT